MYAFAFDREYMARRLSLALAHPISEAILNTDQAVAHTAIGAAAPPSNLEAMPLATWRGQVLAEWIDYNGHMTEHRYLQCFGEATDALLRLLGVDDVYLASGRSFYTVESHLIHRGQAKLNDRLAVATQLLASDPKRLHLFHAMMDEHNTVLATAEHMLLHVDTEAERSVPAEAQLLAAMEEFTAAHESLPRPVEVGRFVGAPRR